jgi:aspartyl protease family protein
MRAVIIFLGLVAAVGIGLSRYMDRMFAQPGGPPSMSAFAKASAPPPQQQASTTGRTVTLQGDSRGHFEVEARIDGRRIELIVDSGASMIVLRESSAARLGIFTKPSDYTGRSQTANGVAKFAPVRLSRVEVNGITVRDVAAAVMPDDALKVNLLGMTFLSRVKWTHDRGRLVLEQ